MRGIGLFILFNFLMASSFGEELKPLSRTINEKAFLIGLNSSLFNTTGVYNDSGSSYKLSQSELFQKYDYGLLSKYGFSRDLELFGDINLRSIMAKTSSAENNILGLESFSLGTKYQMRPIGSLTFAWEAYYRKTFYSKSQKSTLTLLAVKSTFVTSARHLQLEEVIQDWHINSPLIYAKHFVVFDLVSKKSLNLRCACFQKDHRKDCLQS